MSQRCGAGRRCGWLALLLSIGCRAAPAFSPLSADVTASSAPEDDPGNVLLLVLDDVGAEMIRAYGIAPEDAPPTPNIEALAREGVLFRRAWSEPWCSPGRAAILTGEHARRLGIGRAIEPFDESTSLPLDVTTIAERLATDAPVDYRRALIGKWHLSSSDDGLDAPRQHGFEHFAGTLANLDRDHAFDGQPMSYVDWERIEDGVLARTTDYATSRVVDDTLAWVADAPEPWFAWVAFQAAHAPWHSPPAELHHYGDVSEAPKHVRIRAMIEAIDTEIGRLLAGIGPDRLAHTTVVVIGDNGSPGDAGVGLFRGKPAKSTASFHGVHVPLILSGPVVARPGSEVGAIVQGTDLFATIAELGGVDTEAVGLPPDSVSLLPYLRDPDTPPRRAWVYAEAFTPNAGDEHRRSTDQRIAYDGRFELIRSHGSTRLYDLGDDELEGEPIPIGDDPVAEQARASLGAVLDGAWR